MVACSVNLKFIKQLIPLKSTTTRNTLSSPLGKAGQLRDNINSSDYTVSVVYVRNVIWSTGRIKLTWETLRTLRITSPTVHLSTTNGRVCFFVAMTHLFDCQFVSVGFSRCIRLLKDHDLQHQIFQVYESSFPSHFSGSDLRI